MATSGDQKTLHVAPGDFDIGQVTKGVKQRFLVRVGEFSSGAPVELPVVVIRGDADGPVVFVGAGQHGEEPAGMDAVKRLSRQTQAAEVSGTIVAVPLQNVPAYVHRQRLYPLDAPAPTDIGSSTGDANGLLTARIVHALVDCICRDIDFSIDIHATHLDSINYPRAMLTSSGTESEELQAKRYELGKATGYEIIHLWLRKGRTGGLTSLLNGRGVPAIAIEAGEGWRALEPFPSILLRGTHNVLKHLHVLAGEPEMPDLQVDITKRHEVTANHGGMSHLKVKTGDFVRKGQVLAEVRNMFDDTLEELTAPSNGIIVRTSLLPIVNTGARVCNVYETDVEAWEHRRVPELERQIVVSGF